MAARMALEMPMRIFKVLNIAILYVLVGSAAVLYAQDEKQEDHPAAQQDAAKPQPKQDQAHDDNAKVPRQEETKPPKPQEKQDNMREQDQMREQSGKQEAAPGQPDHPGQPGHEGQATPSQRMGNDHPGNNRGGHIPDDQFRARFGREHHFRAQGVIVAGQPQFEYSGYTFELVNPWPADWAYTDDCYVDYVDGEYYLIDLAHPGVEIALIVLM